MRFASLVPDGIETVIPTAVPKSAASTVQKRTTKNGGIAILGTQRSPYASQSKVDTAVITHATAQNTATVKTIGRLRHDVSYFIFRFNSYTKVFI